MRCLSTNGGFTPLAAELRLESEGVARYREVAGGLAGKGPLRVGELEAALVCGADGDQRLRIDLDGPGEALSFSEQFGIPLLISEATWKDRAVRASACGMDVRQARQL